MLRSLAIRQFAIIDRVEVSLDSGFGVITGETGAGKSILVDALGLLVGARADATMVAKGAKHADLTALFELQPQSPGHEWLVDHAMEEPDNTLIIRRTIQSSGGSRAWINGHPVNASQLKELGGLLVEIHGQHAHQNLSSADHQRALVDTACPRDSRVAVTESFGQWKAAMQALEAFEADIGDQAQRELLAFQAEELLELGLQPGEFERLEAEQEKHQRFREIQEALSLACHLLSNDEQNNAHALLLRAMQRLEPISHLDSQLKNAVSLLQEASININEAVADLEAMVSDSEDDPALINTIDQRLESALKLARKHRVSPDELPALADTLSKRLEAIENQDEQRDALVQSEKLARSQWQTAASALSKARQSVASQLSKTVSESLKSLGMTHATLSVEINRVRSEQPSPHGLDEVSILFSANPGQPPKSLAKVASGGELSRVALALMLALGDKDQPMTRIFDEVDAGIGGETAHKVGDFLSRLGQAQDQQGQALCVTHLPQVAARADQHFRVTKDQSDRTTITITALDPKERIAEIARMLGDASSHTSMAHAKAMLDNQTGT